MESGKYVYKPQRSADAETLRPQGEIPAPFICLALFLSVALAACGTGSSGSTNPPPVPHNSALWSAEIETGDLSEWYAPAASPGGDVENIGNAAAIASTDFAHTGKFSAKLTITTPGAPVSGAQLFRWLESEKNSQLYYSVWYYFPQAYSPSQFWNLMEWKSKHTISGVTTSDPFFSLEVGALSSGEMYFYLGDNHTNTSYPSAQPPMPIPVSQWIHVEAFYKSNGNGAGEVTIWQDGTQLWDIRNADTGYADGTTQWSVNSYSTGLTPATATIYVDDVAISTSRMPTP